jgi:hypothetical protein
LPDVRLGIGSGFRPGGIDNRSWVRRQEPDRGPPVAVDSPVVKDEAERSPAGIEHMEGDIR